MIRYPYQNVAPSVNHVINEEWNREWIRENNTSEENEPDNKPWEKKFTSSEDETSVNRLRANHTFLNPRYLMGSHPVPPCEPCQNYTMTLEYI